MRRELSAKFVFFLNAHTYKKDFRPQLVKKVENVIIIVPVGRTDLLPLNCTN